MKWTAEVCWDGYRAYLNIQFSKERRDRWKARWVYSARLGRPLRDQRWSEQLPLAKWSYGLSVSQTVGLG